MSVVVTYETVRCRCDKFGEGFARCAKSVRRKPGSTWHLDEMFATLRGEPSLLWPAVDEHGAELDVLVQKHGRRRALLPAGAAIKPGAAQDRYRSTAQLSGGEG
ncbi:hypothetical protein PTKU46_78370 [Paraburkholderia terrae]